MTTEHEMAIEIAKEVGRQVPVKQLYDDTTSPAAKQVGATFEDIVKCVRLIAFPIQWLAVQQDRFRLFMEKAKDSIPEERRILPAPQILGPILEGIKYEFQDTEVVDMFRSLLSTSMDSERLKQAHPAYPNIIRQLSTEEAKLLIFLYNGPLTGEVVQESGRDPIFVPAIGVLPDDIDLIYVDFYVDHLTSLGLVYTDISRNFDSTRTFDNGFADQAWVGLQPLGKRFVSACHPRS